MRLGGLEGGVSYHGLWHILTRVKWLYQVGEIEAGVSLAMETIPLAQRMSDRNLLIRMKLIAAEGLGRTRRQLEGAALLSEAIGPHARAPLEIMAEAMRVTGRITAQVDSPASQDHYRRALQVFDTVGNITARDDVLRDSNESLGSGTHLIPEAHPEGSFARDESTVRLPVASAIASIAGLMQFAVLPPLIARELLTLVADMGPFLTRRLPSRTNMGNENSSHFSRLTRLRRSMLIRAQFELHLEATTVVFTRSSP